MGNHFGNCQMSISDQEDENIAQTLLPVILGYICENEHDPPQPQSTWVLSGNIYLQELLDGNVHTDNKLLADSLMFLRHMVV
jgi:hypothetical protein